MNLFTPQTEIGVFRGFSEGGLEFHADIILPYRSEFQRMPMHGLFLAVQLEHENEAVLGRVTAVAASGKLSSSSGEDYSIRAMGDGRPIPEELRERYLKYEVDVRVLGLIRVVNDEVVFAASHRRLPHVGSKVAILAPDVLQEIAWHNDTGAELGYLAFGEFVHSDGDARFRPDPWMLVQSPLVVPKFDARSLVSRRTFVFAKAGFGKSNLVKLLFTNLYRNGSPTVKKRGDRQVPVGTLIFDPDGEYFWPDDKGRPGLCDVPDLEDKVVVFTQKEAPSEFYRSFVAGGIRLDIRRLRPSDVISIALSPERQEQQNVRKLKALSAAAWGQLVDEVHSRGFDADDAVFRSLLGLAAGQQDAELYAAKANLNSIVRLLHDPSSMLLDNVLDALEAGRICIVDVSQMRGAAGFTLAGIILRQIFEHNQAEFTKREPRTIPTIVVIEEAQSVLGGSGSLSDIPFVEWVKEGRKYDLGAVLITQQPGSLSHELLSQGDNWFLFHLLSAGDLQAAKKANAHLSDDLLSSLLNEPIPGHGIVWSSATPKNRSYPISIRAMLFEQFVSVHDPAFNAGPGRTYASTQTDLKRAQPDIPTSAQGDDDVADPDAPAIDAGEQPPDPIRTAILAVASDATLRAAIVGGGRPWMAVQTPLMERLANLRDANKVAFNNVSRVLDEMFGHGKWRTEKRPRRGGGGTTTWVVVD